MTPDGVQSFDPGERIANRYQVTRLLGRGGMGEVYEVLDLELTERVALKVLRTEAATLRDELKLARRVTHPNVCRLFDLGFHSDRKGETPREVAFLTMELVEGETLEAKLAREGKLSIDDALPLAEQLCAGIAAAHAVGIVHGDLKSSNVLLRLSPGEPPRALISDFGIARPSGAGEKSGPMAGTPAFMAPEQVEGGEATPASDLYALGVILFQAVTGQLPFSGPSAMAVLARKLAEPAPSPSSKVPGLPPRWERAILGCLERAPANRFKTAGEVLDALHGRLDVSPWRRRRRRALTAIVAFAVLGLGAGAWRLRDPLPASERKVLITAVNEGPARDDSFARTVRALVSSRWKDDRRFTLVELPEQANTVVTVHFKRAGEKAWLDVFVGPAGGPERRIGTLEAASVRDSLDVLAPKAAAVLGAGQSPRPLSPAERETLARFGARSPEQLALYREGEGFLSTVAADTAVAQASLKRLIAEDPGWAHPWAMLALSQGSVSEQARATVAEARKNVRDPARDPAGMASLDALDAAAQNDAAKVIALLEPVFLKSPDDPVVGWPLSMYFKWAHRPDDAVGVSRQLYLNRPEMQFGADLAETLVQVGRADEIPRLLEEWRARAPDSEQAEASAVALDLDRKDFDGAVWRQKSLLWVHGRTPNRLVALCDVLLAADRRGEARGVADELVAAGGLHRHRGLFRLGVLGILDGRFGTARESLRASLDAGKDLGLESEMVQVYESLAAIEGLIAPASRERTLLAQADQFEKIGGAAHAAFVRLEVALLHRETTGCPQTDKVMAALGDGPMRDAVRRVYSRAAASQGCGTCAAAIREGLAPAEESTQSLLEFGLCAEREGSLPLAADVLGRASNVWLAATTTQIIRISPFHGILAWFHLARVQEKLGHSPKALASYERFLSFWGKSDVAVPEVAEAQRAIQRLKAR